MLKEHIPTPKDPLGAARKSFPGHLEGFGQPEVRPSLSQFSMQWTSSLDWTDADIYTQLDLASLPGAIKTINFFGASMFGKMVEYQGILGYNPERVRDIERSNCCPLDFDEPPSKIFRAHNMSEYGSGGLPVFLRSHRVHYRLHSAASIDALSRQYASAEFIEDIIYSFRRLKTRCERFVDLAWCRTARSIQACWNVSTALDSDWSVWLLKVAVHAACTLERATSGALDSSVATIVLFQLSREIGTGLRFLLTHARVSRSMAAVAALLMETGFGFISAGLFQIPLKEQDTGFTQLLFGLAEACACYLTSVTHLVSNSTPWKELATICMKETNFCPSRQISTVIELHSQEMFHLMARSKYITTSRMLHKACGKTCLKAHCTDNNQHRGHLDEGCKCPTRCFKTIETSELVLFDTVNQELVVPKSHTSYIAVSQIWFQGIFGQASRTCRQCTLSFLRTTCAAIGVRYAWIDTLCMPTLKDLRDEVVTQLRNIYFRADATLVVDIGLLTTAARTVLDLSLAILLSDWSSRIWTLQEGVLASKLLFCVGDQVLALPQVNGPYYILDPRSMVPSKVMALYGARKHGLDQPLSSLLTMAAGRQTAYPCDYLYGLSAFLPSPLRREKNLELVAIEVARMHKSVDLGVLQVALPRCRTEGYRWMPLGAKTMVGYSSSNIIGRLENGLGGLRCQIAALIELTSVVDIYSQRKEPRLWASMMSNSASMGIKYWYSTEMTGVYVGTSVEAESLVFCLVVNIHVEMPRGFVVSPTTFHGRDAYRYVGIASVIGAVPGNSSENLVT